MKACDFTKDLSGAVSARINDLREGYGEAGLQLTDNLQTEAQNWANELALKNEEQDSPIFTDLIYRAWFYNLPIDVTPYHVTKNWVKYPEMRAKLLNSSQTKIGLGCAIRYNAPKSASVFVVAFFE